MKYIIFTPTGARITKNKSFGAIECPKDIPLHIPMHYWKHENGQIVEMIDKEKKKVNKALKKEQKKLPQFRMRIKHYIQIVGISTITAFLVYMIINNYIKGL